MATVTPGAPIAPADVGPQIAAANGEKTSVGKTSIDNNAQEIPRDDEKKYDTDGSENFQEGVNRMRAITTVWSRKTLFSMFAL